MAYSTDFNDVSLGRAIGGRRTESLQGNPDTVNQYLSSPDSSVHYVPLMDPLPLPQCPYLVVDAYASYPTPPMQHQYISSNSSIVSSNDMSRVMGASMLPEASEGRFCYEPTEYNAAIAHAMPDYASHPPEFINLDMSQGCIALERQNDNFNSVMLSNMSWDQGDTGIPVSIQYLLHRVRSSYHLPADSKQASHSEIDHHRNPTNIPVNTSQPRTQDEQKHVCDKPECGGKLFTRQSDLKRHKDEQHNPEKINFICGCCKDKPKAPSFKRMEKLMDHKNKFHGYVKGARLLHCLEASCQAESTCVLCFCAEDGLEHHMSQAHQYKARCLPDRLHATGLLDETKGTSVRGLICKILICRYSYLLVVGNIQQGSRWRLKPPVTIVKCETRHRCRARDWRQTIQRSVRWYTQDDGRGSCFKISSGLLYQSTLRTPRPKCGIVLHRAVST
jgi:hypothetical protein